MDGWIDECSSSVTHDGDHIGERIYHYHYYSNRYNIQSLTGVQLVEHFILFIVVWGTILPIIITQALFSYRDDIIYNIIIHHSENTTSPSIVTCMIPVLLMSGCLFFIFSVFSWLLKTSFQVRLTNYLYCLTLR